MNPVKSDSCGGNQVRITLLLSTLVMVRFLGGFGLMVMKEM